MKRIKVVTIKVLIDRTPESKPNVDCYKTLRGKCYI